MLPLAPSFVSTHKLQIPTSTAMQQHPSGSLSGLVCSGSLCNVRGASSILMGITENLPVLSLAKSL